jgi:hypothetical protein
MVFTKDQLADELGKGGGLKLGEGGGFSSVQSISSAAGW